MYIAFEGIDGSGKMTQTALLCERLRRTPYTPISLFEPTFGKFGREIRALAYTSEGEKEFGIERQRDLFTNDRKDHVNLKIKPLLDFVAKNPSFLIIQDRCYLSDPAYQARSETEAIEFLKEQQTFAPKPDIIFLLDLPVEVAVERLAQRRKQSMFEREAFLQDVRRRYLFLAEEGSERIERVDATGPPDSICDKVRALLSLDDSAS